MNDNQFWMNLAAHPLPGDLFIEMNEPEYLALLDTPQDFRWHPEGNAGLHTFFVMNFAAFVATRDKLDAEQRAVLIFSAMGHDFAKATTTETKIIDGEERITSPGHEKASGPMMRDFLERKGIDENIIAQVVPLVENHLVHILFADKMPDNRVLRRLRRRLEPSNVEMLGRLIEADASGRPPSPFVRPSAVDRMIAAINALGPDKPAKKAGLLNGSHLITMGMVPGPDMGYIIRQVAEMEAEGRVTNEVEAIEAAKFLLGK